MDPMAADKTSIPPPPPPPPPPPTTTAIFWERPPTALDNARQGSVEWVRWMAEELWGKNYNCKGERNWCIMRGEEVRKGEYWGCAKEVRIEMGWRQATDWRRCGTRGGFDRLWSLTLCIWIALTAFVWYTWKRFACALQTCSVIHILLVSILE